MKGYQGKILRVNLTDQTVKKESLDIETAQKFLGGRGLATNLFYDEVKPTVDPFSPDNKILFMTGPTTGTSAPTGGRYMVITKSPLSGTIACSNSGGYWGAELKFAGYDGIIVEGKAQAPVSININDDQVEIVSAENVWGKSMIESSELLAKDLSEKTKILAIGTAGENLSPIAAVMNDIDRAAGRSGVGAVMGSKNLKAITVKGSKKVEVAADDTIKEVVRDAIKKIRDHGVTGQGLPTYGTAVLVNVINENGVFPASNFQQGFFATADAISGETLAEKYLVKKTACYRCPIACGRHCKTDKIEGGGPEYESIWAFGADCGVDDLEAIIEANFWCNETGMDTISAGATVATAMELYQKGYIKEEELAGVPLNFGDGQALITWIKRMGFGETELGQKMALGSYRLAEMYGVPELSMSVKKLELPAYDPRGIQGQALAYATSNRGGCHVRAYLISPEILGVPEKLDRHSLEGKAQWAKIFQDLTAVIDSMGLCLFTSFALGAEEYAAILNAVTGTNHSAESLLEAGERIWNLERLFNLEAGISAAEDTLPPRLLKEPIPAGPSEGHLPKLDQLLPEYYKLRGWDEKGTPTATTKERLLI